jgi:hypothetical protein
MAEVTPAPKSLDPVVKVIPKPDSCTPGGKYPITEG